MGEHLDDDRIGERERRQFAAQLLGDVQALDIMQKEGMFESGVRRIGAEQEFCLVDDRFRPSLLGPEILQAINDPHFTTEIAKYTLEINLDPHDLEAAAFGQLHSQLDDLLARAKAVADQFNNKIVLIGILPTISTRELDSRYLTPSARYHTLEQRIRELRGGGDVELMIQGIDDLMMRHDNLLFEACNTSFQVHLQVSPEDFVDNYNWALAISGVVLAASTNSPMLFGRDLWAETRIALFQQSVDTRSRDMGLRQRQARVYFGNRWIRKNLAEIFQEDIARYPLIFGTEVEDSLKILKEGGVPKLRALALHNGTIWKWNRPCFGSNGKIAHLRIENRYLPAGPTTADEIANTAFWIGLMCGMPDSFREIWKSMDFLEVKDNFIKAAQHGLDVELSWKRKTKNARAMILDDFLPIAETGLRNCNVSAKDISHYLGIIEHRMVTRMTGSRWIKQALRNASDSLEPMQRLTAVTESYWNHQQSRLPMAVWPATPIQADHQRHFLDERADVLMSTDLITVAGDDLAALAQRIMEWKNIRHVPVESLKGEIAGLITSNDIDALCKKHSCDDLASLSQADDDYLRCNQIMVADPVCIPPDCTLREARTIMLDKKIGCLPVVVGKKLIGIVTKKDVLRIAERTEETND